MSQARAQGTAALAVGETVRLVLRPTGLLIRAARPHQFRSEVRQRGEVLRNAILPPHALAPRVKRASRSRCEMRPSRGASSSRDKSRAAEAYRR